LEDAHLYRTSYEQAKVAQDRSASETDTRCALERTAELERMVGELTEYVEAKERQLETYKQVNEQLQEEIHGLAQVNLRTNEV